MLFNNAAEKGAFGEFVYQRYVEGLKKFKIEPRRICEHDFFVCNEFGREYRVDVKTTSRNLTRYAGPRISKEISYDLVVIGEEDVRIYPDSNSPIIGREIFVDEVQRLYDAWRHNKQFPIRHVSANSQTDVLALIRQQLEQFGKSRGLRFRLIYRGPASNKRWGKRRPDNIIPMSGGLSNHDFTIFVQLACLNFNEVLENLYLFKHDCFNQIPTHKADKRQLKKGVSRVIDLEDYARGFPQYVFPTLPALLESFEKEAKLLS